MSAVSLTKRALQLMEEITVAGPVLPEFDGLRVFDHPDRLLNQLTGKTGRVPPVTLDLWPSLTCNARCPLCQYRVSGARDEVDSTDHLEIMSPTVADSIFSGAARIGVRSVILTGGGEPTLNPYLVDIARLARIRGLRWSLNTNAFLLDRDLAVALLAELPSYLKISVDAGTSETHSQIYNLKTNMYQKVLDHAVITARASAAMGSRNVGISFSLGSKTSDEELDRIREAIEYVIVESLGTLGFVVFRARLLHYRGWAPVVPQPNGERFRHLANALEDRITQPLSAVWGNTTKFDLKKGLFLLAAREDVPSECFSNSWMTTITQEGYGYATGELAGAAPSGQCWGRIVDPVDFEKLWYGPLRCELHERIECGRIPLPIVHRTSPIDEFFRRFRKDVGERLSPVEVGQVIASVERAKWYRSKNSVFV